MKRVFKILFVLLYLTVFAAGAVAQDGEQIKEISKAPATPTPSEEQLRQAMLLGMQYQAMMYPPDRSYQGYPIPWAYNYRPRVVIPPPSQYSNCYPTGPYNSYCRQTYPGYRNYPAYPPTYPWPVNKYAYPSFPPDHSGHNTHKQRREH